MYKIKSRNTKGGGLACKNQVMIRLNDDQFSFLNKLSEDLKMSKTEIFRWLLEKEYDKRCVKFDVDDVILCEKNNEKIPNWDEIKW